MKNIRNNIKINYRSLQISFLIKQTYLSITRLNHVGYQSNLRSTGNNLRFAGNDLLVDGINLSLAGNELGDAGKHLRGAGKDLPSLELNLSGPESNLSGYRRQHKVLRLILIVKKCFREAHKLFLLMLKYNLMTDQLP